MTELCLMVAPNGARRTKADHAMLPITAQELAETAKACQLAGANAFHLHVRDDAEAHSLDAARYQEAMAAIKKVAPSMVIQPTTEAAGRFGVTEQISAVKALQPGCVSFSLAELLRDGPERASEFLRYARAQNLAIQFILYDAAQIGLFARMWRAGQLYLDAAPRIILVAGRYAADQNSELADFEALYQALKAEDLHEQAIWMLCAFGRGELACLERCISLGGHARVGFENAIHDSSGALARDNAQRVALVAEIAARHGRALATPTQTRALMGLHQL